MKFKLTMKVVPGCKRAAGRVAELVVNRVRLQFATTDRRVDRFRMAPLFDHIPRPRSSKPQARPRRDTVKRAERPELLASEPLGVFEKGRIWCKPKKVPPAYRPRFHRSDEIVSSVCRT